jgi:hypothetical protein
MLGIARSDCLHFRAGFELCAAHGHSLPGRQVLAIALGSAHTQSHDEGRAARPMQFVQVFVLQQRPHSSEFYVITDTLCLLGSHHEVSHSHAAWEALQRSLSESQQRIGTLTGELEEARRAAALVEDKADAAERKLRRDFDERHKVGD